MVGRTPCARREMCTNLPEIWRNRKVSLPGAHCAPFETAKAVSVRAEPIPHAITPTSYFLTPNS